MNLPFQINTSPNLDNLTEIKVWLFEEYTKTNSGFYCNWNVIEKSFESKNFIVFQNNNSVIGFICWFDCEIYATIEIMEIKPNYRGKGLGKLFYEKVAEYFKSIELIAVKLFCTSISSEEFWKKMGFVKFPDRGYSDPDMTYFKPLIEINCCIENECENKLELWDLEPYQLRSQKPRWTWNIENESLGVFKPILQPCNGNWNLRLTRNNEIVKEDKVKYFSSKKNKIEFSPFLYIKKLD